MKAGGEGELHGVFQGLLDNSEVEVKKKKKRENGDVVRRRREEEPV